MEHCLVPIGLAALNEQSRLPLQDELTDKLPAAGLTILEAEASGDLLGRAQFERMQGAPRKRCFLHAQSRAPMGREKVETRGKEEAGGTELIFQIQDVEVSAVADKMVNSIQL